MFALIVACPTRSIRHAIVSFCVSPADLYSLHARDRIGRLLENWLAREHALWEEAAALDPGDDPALRSLHDEAVRSLQWTGLLRRVLAVATSPQ